ncbi:MAG: pyridoxal phosphate-dependent aminotransferase [Planctomycetes bacterium]|nr:pyridoxal phosphate-dependent aminotransferase [Planctomycetota bacterium]
MISSRARAIAPSETLAITEAARLLKAQGRDVIGLAAGEPDFDTPPHIKEAAARAMARGETKYTAAAGTLILREAIERRTREDTGAAHDPATEVLVSCGAKHALANLFLAVLDPGDEVVIPSPYWVSYPMMAVAAGARPVFVETRAEEGYALDPGRLRRALGPRTRMVVLNSPSNPTGAVMDAAATASVLETLRDSPALVVSDEIYDRLVYDGAPVSPASLDGWGGRVVVVNGVSKAYAMTGWRIGWAVGPREVIQAATRVQSHTASAPSSISQAAALAALTGPQDCVETMREAFDVRRRYVVGRLSAIQGLQCPTPRGAFYAFPRVSDLFGPGPSGRPVATSAEFCALCLEETGVALVPGGAFGADRHVRLSYATSRDLLAEALERLAGLAERLLGQGASRAP